MTYSKIIKEYNASTSIYSRYRLKLKARKFPEYNSTDFEKHKITYQKLVKKFNDLSNVPNRLKFHPYSLKFRAKQYPEYNPVDFIMQRNPYRNLKFKTYKEYILKANQSKGIEKYGIKAAARKYFPLQYNRTDFSTRSNRSFEFLTYKQIVQQFKQNKNPHCYQFKISAKKYHPEQFNKNDFLREPKLKLSDKEISFLLDVFEIKPLTPKLIIILKKLLNRKISRSHIKPISNREKDIFNMRLGINQPKSTFVTISKKYNISSRYTYRLFNITIEKLLKLRLPDSHLSYEEIVKKHNDLTNLHRKTYLKSIGRKYSQFNSFDFIPNSKQYLKIPYPDLVIEYNKSINGVKRGRLKFKAKKHTEYNPSDFKKMNRGLCIEFNDLTGELEVKDYKLQYLKSK
jgi:hypothetical protein